MPHSKKSRRNERMRGSESFFLNIKNYQAIFGAHIVFASFRMNFYLGELGS